MRLKYVGQFAEVELYDTGEWVAQGETIDVSPALGGRPPSGEPGTDDYDPGEGLLAQPSNWAIAEEEKPAADEKPPPKHRAKHAAAPEAVVTDGGES